MIVPVGYTIVVMQISEVSKSSRMVISRHITYSLLLGTHLMRDQVKNEVGVR